MKRRHISVMKLKNTVNIYPSSHQKPTSILKNWRFTSKKITGEYNKSR